MGLIIKWRIRILKREVSLNPVYKLEEFLFECLETVHDKTVYPIKNFFRNIHSLFKWLPIIWDDRDWDECYLLRILEFKFKNMSKYHKEHGHTLRAEETARELLIMSEYCARLNGNFRGNGIFPTTKKKKKFLNTELLGLNRMQIDMLQKHRRDQKKAFAKLLTRKLDTWWD